jgi:peroxiredoxin
VALFAVPGAFTPTCSARHLPGYKEKAAEFRAKGVDTIACVSVNDVFVMDAWGKDQQVGEDVVMLADGNGAFAKAVGLEMDGSGFGMGSRSQALFDDRREWRGEAAERGSAGRVQGQRRRLHAGPALGSGP